MSSDSGSDPSARRDRPRSFVTILAVTLAAAGVVFVASSLLRIPIPVSAVASLAGGALLLFSASGYGGAFLRLWPSLRTDVDDGGGSAWERWSIECLLGLGILPLFVFAIGVGGFLRAGPALALLAFGSVLSIANRRGARRDARRCRKLGGLERFAIGVGIVPVFAFSLLASLPPSTWFDALEYHLVIPASYVIHGRIVEMPDNFFSHLPHAIELLDALLMAVDRSLRPAPFHWGIGLVTATLIARLTRRHLHPAAGWLAAAIFFNFSEAASSLYIEGVDLALAGAAAFSIDLFLSSARRPKLLPASLLLAGIASSFKGVHGGMVALAVLLAIAFFRRRQLAGAEGRALAVVSLAAFVAPLVPWGVLNLVRHANPVYPFLGSLFGEGPEHARWIDWIASNTRVVAIDSGNILRFPKALAAELFETSDWSPLPLAALVVPLFRSRWRRSRETFVVMLSLLLLWQLVAAVPRYALPWLAVASPLAASVIGGLVTMPRRRIAKAAAIGLVGTILGLSSLRSVLQADTFRKFFPYLEGAENEVEYSSRMVMSSPAALYEWANANLPADARVLSLDEPRLYGLWRPFEAATIFDRRTLDRFLEGGSRDTPELLAVRIRERGFTHLLINPPFAEVVMPKKSLPFGYGPEEARLIEALLSSQATLLFEKNGAALFQLNDAAATIQRR